MAPVPFPRAPLHPIAALACWLAALAGVSAQSSRTAPPVAVAGRALAADATGEEIYGAACRTCHGPDGKGSPRTVVGFDTPLPDFTDCAFASAEADADWRAVVHEGGPIRGLTRRMPAFGDALSAAHIDAVIGYVRHFCTEPAWPPGDLNLPRAFFTEKAFPENEIVYTNTIARGDEAILGNEVVYERRLGARNQIEAVIPVDRTKHDGGWQAGLGDVAVAFRRTIVANRRSGTIAAAGGEVAFPTGDAERGLGRGYRVLEPFGMVGQSLPHNVFLQAHGGLEIPSDTAASTEVYLRSAAGFTYLADRGFGRAWSPQLEVLFARPFDGDAEWDLVPQMQVTLSKIQHVSVAGGVRIPLSQRGERRAAVVTYLVWDWFDGPFTSFWK
jgi:mono/diheme cytochrome c family protein